MLNYVFRFFGWAFKKFAGGVLIVALLVVGFGLWLYLRDGDGTDMWKHERVRAMGVERKTLQNVVAEAHRKMDRVSAEMTAEQERAKQIDKVLAQLRELDSSWDKLTGNAEQQKANAERIVSLTATRLAATNKLAALQQDFNRATWARDTAEGKLAQLTEKIEVAKEEGSPVLDHIARTWTYELGWRGVTLPVSEWAFIALLLYFVGPGLARVFIYYFVAPSLVARRSVRLAKAAENLPFATAAMTEIPLELKAGQRLWVREKYLREADASFTRGSRSLLDGGIPFSCYVTGLVKLAELRATQTAQVTLAAPAGTDGALAVVALEEGSSLVLRPSFLVGVVTGGTQKLKIRRRWKLFHWQSWVMWQFRHFEFAGPATLIVGTPEGLRVEQLADVAEENGPRTMQQVVHEATVAFTPGLAYQAVLTKSFFGYLGGSNSLFDDRFSGRGLFLYQIVSPRAKKRRRRRSPFGGIWARTTRLFGL